MSNEIDTLCYKSNEIIRSLYEKYSDNPYMFLKIQNYICVQLPNIMRNMDENHKYKVKRIEDLSTEQDAFINRFLNNNKYFYVHSTEKFFYYDGSTYNQSSEDNILCNILNTISWDRQLTDWKQKTKVSIMKRIKDNSLLKSIPESVTIQRVLSSLYPALFSTKQEAKYFLTVIGDNIFKKKTSNLHFIHHKSKSFIRELNNICQVFFGVNLGQSFKYKYYDHDYNSCRIITINDCVKNTSVWMPFFTQFGLDIICIACHYSIRYSNSDEYASLDNVLSERVFYLKNTTQSNIVDLFTNKYLYDKGINCDNDKCYSGLSWKDMQFLWKQFLDNEKIPMIMFHNIFKQHILQKYSYDEETELFVGIYSKYLPSINKFINFWNENMEYDESESDLEIEEISILFKKWCKSSSNMNETQLLDIISCYYPDTEIENDKYIQKYRCRLWDKEADILTAINKLAEDNVNEHSIYSAYMFYCKFYSSNGEPNHILVSKTYFEKYLSMSGFFE